MTRKGAQSLILGLIAAIAAPLLARVEGGRPQKPADLVLRNGRVVTVDPARPEAQAVAIAEDRIAAVGTDEEISRLIGPRTEVIDLAGRLAIPGFVESHGERLGPARAKSGAYLWRSLLDAGVVIANGTDTPVEDIDPIASFHASVTRRMADGTPFHPEQRMTREEALRSYTLNGAYAAFEEDVKGSITPGKLADVVVLSRDILKVPESEIPAAKVVLTILGGRVRWRR